MESTPVSPGLSESSFNRPEAGKNKDDKDKKDSRKTASQRLGIAVPEKTKDKGIVEFFHRPDKDSPNESKLFNAYKEQKGSAAASTEPEHETALPKAENQLIEPELRMPTPDEAWAGIEQGQKSEQKQPTPLELKRSLAAELPMEIGEIELPLEATELHKRLQLPKAEAEDKPIPELSRPSKAERADVPETQLEQPTLATGENGGGNFEPPSGPEHPESSPEPGPEQPKASATPAEISSDQRTQEYQQHQARIANAVPVSELPPPVASLSETRVIERGGGALLVGIIDWFGRRRLRKEVRRGQKRQDKQIKQLKLRQNQSTELHQQQLTTQESHNQHLRKQIDTLFRGRDQQRQQFELQHNLLLEERRRAQAAESARRAALQTAAETSPQLPADHHLEHSTWHTIEVDKSGRAVEQPTFAYGKEFQHEQQQETRRDDPRVAATATGQLAVNGTATTDNAQPLPTSGLHIPPSMQDDATHRPPTRQFTPVLQNPWFLVVAIIIFFAIVSLIIVH